MVQVTKLSRKKFSYPERSFFFLLVSELEMLDALLLLSRCFELWNEPAPAADLEPGIPLPPDNIPREVDALFLSFFFEMPGNDR